MFDLSFPFEVVEQFDKFDCFVVVHLCQSVRELVTERKIYRRGRHRIKELINISPGSKGRN